MFRDERRRRLRTERWPRATAEVTKCWVKYGDNGARTFYVSYKFRDAVGVKRGSTSRHGAKKYGIGEQIEVMYDPESSDRSDVPSHGVFPVVMSSIIATMGGVVLGTVLYVVVRLLIVRATG